MTQQKSNKRKRRWPWVIAAVLVLLLLTAVFLPQLLPKNIIKNQIASQLSSQLGREVTIGRVEISWRQGVNIYGTHIARRQGFGQGQMLTIEQIWCPFQPIQLLQGRIKKLTIQKMDIYCVIDAQGRLNLADLLELQQSDSQTAIITQIKLDQIAFHILDQLRDRRQTFEIQQAEIISQEDGSTTWQLQAYQPGDLQPTITSQGSYGLIDLASQGPAKPNGRLLINSLNLGNLQLNHWVNAISQKLAEQNQTQPINLTALTGLCSAEINFQMLSDSTIDLDVHINLDSINVQAANVDQPLAQNFDLDINSQCSINLLAEPIATLKLTVQNPAIDIVFNAAIDFSPAAALPLMADWQAAVNPQAVLQTLSYLQPVFDTSQAQPIYPTTTIVGQLQCNPAADWLTCSIQTDGPLRLPDNSLNLDQPITIAFSSTLNRQASQLQLRTNRLDWPAVQNAAITADIPIPAMFPPITQWQDYTAWWQTTINRLTQQQQFTFNANMQIQDFAAFAAVSPQNILLPPSINLQGPLSFKAQLDTVAQTFSMSAELPEQTILIVRETSNPYSPVVFTKNQGQPLHISTQTDFDLTANSTSNLSLTADHAAAQFTFSQAQLQWNLTPDNTINITKAQGQWQVSSIQDWLAILPGIAAELNRQQMRIQGSCAGDINFQNLPTDSSLQTTADFTPLAITINDPAAPDQQPIFDKPADTLASLELSLTRDPYTDQFDYQTQLRLANIQTSVQGSIASTPIGFSEQFGISPQHHQLNCDFTIDDIQQLTMLLPGIFAQQEQSDYQFNQLQGPAQFHSQADFHTIFGKVAAGSFDLNINADNAGFLLYENLADPNQHADNLFWHKLPQTPMSLQGRLSVYPTFNIIDFIFRQRLMPIAAQLHDVHGKLAGSTLTVDGGLIFDLIPALLNRPWWQILHAADFSWQLDADHSDQLTEQLPLIAKLRDQWSLSGKSQLQGQLFWDKAYQWCGAYTYLDLTETAFTDRIITADQQAIELAKLAGDPLRIDIDAWTSTEQLDQFFIDRFSIDLPGTVIDCNAVIQTAQPLTWADISRTRLAWADINATIDCNDIARIAAWLPEHPIQDIQGRFHFTAGLTTNADLTQLQITPAQMSANIAGTIENQPFHAELDQAHWNDNRLQISALRANLGQSDISVIAELDMPMTLPYIPDPNVQPSHRVDILAANIDLDQISEFMRQFNEPTDANIAASGPDSSPTDLQALQDLIQLLRSIDIAGIVRIDELSFTDPKTEARLVLNQLQSEYQLQEGLLGSSFRAALSGGVVTGLFNGNFNLPDPNLQHQLVGANLQATEALSPMVESEFPGLKVTGTISERRSLHTTFSQLIQSPDPWLGTGTNDCSQGSLYGPGGPGWLMTVIPSLEMVEYPFQRMTNQYQLLPNGQKRNHLTFHGQTYDIYITGISTEIRDPQILQRAFAQLQTDLQDARDEVRRLSQAGQTDSVEFQYYQQRFRGLGILFDRHQQDQYIRVTQAEYQVGALIRSGRGTGELFEQPRELLHTPAFYSKSFIMGKYMIGIQTTSSEQ